MVAEAVEAEGAFMLVAAGVKVDSRENRGIGFVQRTPWLENAQHHLALKESYWGDRSLHQTSKSRELISELNHISKSSYQRVKCYTLSISLPLPTPVIQTSSLTPNHEVEPHAAGGFEK